jgi:hypothetical protein
MMKPTISILYFVAAITLSASLLMSEKIRNENLPEYNEYLRQIGHPLKTTTSTTMAPAEMSPNVAAPFPQFPSLCKDSPKDGDYLAHAYCWVMLIASIVFIFALLIYQMRSILWIKEEVGRRQALKKFLDERDLELGFVRANGNLSNQ